MRREVLSVRLSLLLCLGGSVWRGLAVPRVRSPTSFSPTQCPSERPPRTPTGGGVHPARWPPPGSCCAPTATTTSTPARPTGPSAPPPRTAASRPSCCSRRPASPRGAPGRWGATPPGPTAGHRRSAGWAAPPRMAGRPRSPGMSGKEGPGRRGLPRGQGMPGARPERPFYASLGPGSPVRARAVVAAQGRCRRRRDVRLRPRVPSPCVAFWILKVNCERVHTGVWAPPSQSPWHTLRGVVENCSHDDGPSGGWAPGWGLRAPGTGPVERSEPPRPVPRCSHSGRGPGPHAAAGAWFPLAPRGSQVRVPGLCAHPCGPGRPADLFSREHR